MIASSLDIVSANQSRENIILACLNNLSESVSSTSIFIAFIAGQACAVELTTSSVSLSPPLESGAVRHSLIPILRPLQFNTLFLGPDRPYFQRKLLLVLRSEVGFTYVLSMRNRFFDIRLDY